MTSDAVCVHKIGYTDALCMIFYLFIFSHGAPLGYSYRIPPHSPACRYIRNRLLWKLDKWFRIYRHAERYSGTTACRIIRNLPKFGTNFFLKNLGNQGASIHLKLGQRLTRAKI